MHGGFIQENPPKKNPMDSTENSDVSSMMTCIDPTSPLAMRPQLGPRKTEGVNKNQRDGVVASNLLNYREGG